MTVRSPWDAPATDDADGGEGGDDVAVSRRRLVVLAPVLAVVAVVAVLVVVLATREPAANRIAESPLVGRAAPPVSGTTLDGSRFELADLEGKWVLVNFFATWCGPCQQEHDDLVAFDERHRTVGDGGVVSVVFDDSPANARSFFEENGGEFPVIVDGGGDIALEYGLIRVPESFLVAPNGVIVAKIIGGVTADGLEEILGRFRD